MGRLPPLASLAPYGLLLGLASGCDSSPKPPPAPTKSRNVALLASGSSHSEPSASQLPVAPARPRGPLCGGELLRPGRNLPPGKFFRRAAPGAPELPAQLEPAGRWTWVNFWAAWCVPCKEEIPRLRSWERSLGQTSRPLQLVFVSLDDDARELERFLASQPPDGLRATYWLGNPNEREKWLREAGLGENPELPVHLLLDPSGRLRCIVRGAVEDSDLPQLRALLGAS